MNLSWETFYGIGAALLLAVLIYGMIQVKSRNRANDKITEAATREEYAHPDTYPQRRKALKKKVRPS